MRKNRIFIYFISFVFFVLLTSALSGCLIVFDHIQEPPDVPVETTSILETPDPNENGDETTPTPDPEVTTPVPQASAPITDVQLEDYYRLASDMWDAYQANAPTVVVHTSADLDLSQAMAYIRMLIPRHFQLRETKSYEDDVLVSITYECLFPLAIDESYDQVVSYLHGVVDDNIEPGMTDREKLQVIHDWVVQRNTYPDTYDEDSRSAAALVLRGDAICSGYTDAVKIMCDYAGIPCVNLSGRAVNAKGERGNHGWNAVRVEGEWLHLDATFDDPKSESGEQICIHDYFLITTDEISANHSFDLRLTWEEMRDFAVWYY
ncbi:MAG: hypothetical protein FWE59_05440 [Oscillospiraceae bacterium]|nr:hypothetical protein [Oscillospiraceae bacterium]